MENLKTFTSVGTRTHDHTHDRRSPYQLDHRGWPLLDIYTLHGGIICMSVLFEDHQMYQGPTGLQMMQNILYNLFKKIFYFFIFIFVYRSALWEPALPFCFSMGIRSFLKKQWNVAGPH